MKNVHFFDQMQQDKMQWLQDPTQTNVMQNGTRAKLVGSSGKKRGKITKAKLMNLKQ